jgi:hypothetical protein
MQRSVLWPAGLLCVPHLAINTRLIQDIPHSIPNSIHGYYLSPEAGIIRFVLEQKTLNRKLLSVENESVLLRMDTKSNYGTVSDHIHLILPFRYITTNGTEVPSSVCLLEESQNCCKFLCSLH